MVTCTECGIELDEEDVAESVRLFGHLVPVCRVCIPDLPPVRVRTNVPGLLNH